MFVIREINANDKETVTQLIIEDWGSSIVVSKGKAHDVSSLPGFVAESDGKIAGLITYNVHGMSVKSLLLILCSLCCSCVC
jgi:hypothetical protein